MRKRVIALILAATAATPALAQSMPARSSDRVELAQNDNRAERRQNRAARTERRDNRAARTERRDDRPARAERRENRVERADPRDNRADRAVDRRQNQRVARSPDRREDVRDRREDRRDVREDRGDRREDRRDGRFDGGRRDRREDVRDRREDRRDYREDRWDRREDRGDRFDDRRGGRNEWFRDGRWNNRWRNDRRYDWRSYRRYNPGIFRWRYYAPRGYGYRRFGIGYTLASVFLGANYWLNDPWRYRLPPVYGGQYRWIRYFGDALLVDVRTGRVIDVEYGIFY